VFLRVDLGLQPVESASAIFLFCSGIFRERIATLNDAVADRPVKCGAVISTLARGRDEVRDVVRGTFSQQIEHDYARTRFDHRLLVA
jgi:hypothetical protein